MKIVLASGSITRRKIMDKLKFKYSVVVSDYDENIKFTTPNEYVETLSFNKAINVRKKVNYDALIIAADSIIYKDGKKYEKPKNIDEAINNMKELRGKVNQGITGVTIYDTKNNVHKTFSCVTDVYLKDISDDDILWYVNHEEDLLKKAGYSLEGIMSLFVSKIDGDYYNVLGLPLGKMYSMINEMGYSLKDIE